jgi:hypothetical protein
MFPTRLVICAVSCALLPACSSLQTVKVSASPEMAAASIRVDVTASTQAVQGVSVREYWQPGSPARSGDYSTLHFGPARSAKQEVSKKKWGAKKVMVIADLPGVHGDSDSKIEIPVSGKKVANIEVTSAGLKLVPAAR